MKKVFAKSQFMSNLFYSKKRMGATSSRKQSDPGHFFKSQGKTFQPFLYTLFLTSFLTQL